MHNGLHSVNTRGNVSNNFFEKIASCIRSMHRDKTRGHLQMYTLFNKTIKIKFLKKLLHA